ncbi:MAG: SufE family protein [Candidatus Sumerlaeia bacterium]
MTDSVSDIILTQQQIVDEFSRLEEWEDRYGRIIELGKRLPALEELPEDARDEKFRVRGCQSTVFLKPELREGKIFFQATSDAMIVRGLIALLLRVYSGRTPDEIIRTPPEFIDKIGLSRNLSQGRASGLSAMIEQIKLYAVAFKTLQGRM